MCLHRRSGLDFVHQILTGELKLQDIYPEGNIPDISGISKQTAIDLQNAIKPLTPDNFTWDQLSELLSLPNNPFANDLVKNLIQKYRFYEAKHGETMILNVLNRAGTKMIEANKKATWLDVLDKAWDDSK